MHPVLYIFDTIGQCTYRILRMHQDADIDITIPKHHAPLREIRESCHGFCRSLCHNLWPGNGTKVRLHETTSIFAIPCHPKVSWVCDNNRVYEIFRARTPERI